MEVKSFNQIIGQDMVIEFLKKAVSNNKTATAYLFAGIKGIGKTSTALAFALSLN
jgi:DNA polymerase-3 subunit gamma/tau